MEAVFGPNPSASGPLHDLLGVRRRLGEEQEERFGKHVRKSCVRGGDVICCDDDGVVVVPFDEADEALALSQARIAKEAATRLRLNAGELGLDIYGLRATLSTLGVVYVDTIDEVNG